MLNLFDHIGTAKQATEPQPNALPQLGLAATLGGDDPETPMAKEMRQLYNKPMSFDNKPAYLIAKDVAAKMGVNPSLFFASAFQEGMNKAIVKPDEVSEAYNMAKLGSGFPVDGFYNYGLDRFGDNYEKKYKAMMPEGFEKNFKAYPAINEKNEKIMTAAFANNESALMAKAAMMKDTVNSLSEYAKKKGIELDEDATNYFTMAAYNAGEGNAHKMMEKYAKAKDKKAFLEKGDSEWQKVHRNIFPRLANMAVAKKLLEENQPN